MTRKIVEVSWTNTGISLGSDHHVLEILVPVEGISDPAKRKVLVTGWHAFCRNRIASGPTTIEDLRRWTDGLLSSAELVTVESDATSTSGVSDSKLWHMWQAHRTLQTILQAQARRNGKLRRRIARLESYIEVYPDQLDRQQRGRVCDGLNGNLHCKDIWSLLTVDGSHDHQEHAAGRPLQNHEEVSLSYTGSPNPELDDYIIEADDRNKMLWNLHDRSVTALTALFCGGTSLSDDRSRSRHNEVWRSGSVPPMWKHAVVAFIPKPGKELSVSNLMTICLTSCLGKLFENVIFNRLQAYVEGSDLLPHTSFGYRAHLSTQDLFLQLSREIVEKKREMQALLTLELQKSFDNVKHEAVLSRIPRMHLGLRSFAYVKSFLIGLTAEIRLGEDVLPTFRAYVEQGTPQGAVLSRLLFNFTMMDLPGNLAVIPGLHHSLYADDVTLWSECHVLQVQSALQMAADVVVNHVKFVGLECSHTKSELLVKRGYHEGIFLDEVQVLVNGNRISESDSARVLGMHLRKDLSHADTILRIGKTAKSTTRLIRRIANRRGGVKEGDVSLIVDAFLVMSAASSTRQPSLESTSTAPCCAVCGASSKQ
ncbi:hypothetical protein HPB47_014437 [Ixodes persulcatus]|uniref:Uncharacterized protein n=1 Tax=Ixodes persulcatus TaxID=34615 RepID=A0AC60QVZ4_IXOPE|nr:hypothetical protein HPB47_014437 [Ixodes persulcatus]